MNTLVPLARQNFGNNYHYQEDNVTTHRARVVLDFLQQDNVRQTATPENIFVMNLAMQHAPEPWKKLRQALLDIWAETPVERL